jgi:hypothetical protein
MADPATMAIAGAAIGAATNKKNPLEGAMMGAALGGGGGYLLGGAGAAAAEGAAAEGLLGGGINSAIGNTMVDSSLGAAYQAAGMGAPTAYPVPDVGAYPFESAIDYFKMNRGPGELIDASFAQKPDLFGAITEQPMDYNAIARASMGSDIPGVSAVSGSSPYSGMPKINPMMAMQAMNLTKPQEQPMARGGGVMRGDPRAVQQDAVLSLLAPKRLEKRKISLMG